MKIFTNGCFDILHRGHLELLEYCKHRAGSSAETVPISMRGYVIVGLNSDDSVKRLKGDGRPVNNQRDRKYFLESLTSVDQVILFDEDTPKRLLSYVKPDLIVKGSSSIPSQDETEGYKVKIFDIVENYSTTNIVNEILSNRR